MSPASAGRFTTSTTWEAHFIVKSKVLGQPVRPPPPPTLLNLASSAPATPVSLLTLELPGGCLHSTWGGQLAPKRLSAVCHAASRGQASQTPGIRGWPPDWFSLRESDRRLCLSLPLRVQALRTVCTFCIPHLSLNRVIVETLGSRKATE